MSASRPHIVVIGGGISGLSAAWSLCRPALVRDRAARSIWPRITLLEATDVLGGKIRTSDFAGLPVDEGPDAFLARSPWGTKLCEEIGLGNELTAPTGKPSFVLSRGRLRRFPKNHVLGVPSSPVGAARSGAVSLPGASRAILDLTLPEPVGRRSQAAEDDPSIAQVISGRLGSEISQRLVDPLLGGINGGSVENLSLAAAAPQLAELATSRRSLTLAVRDQIRRRRSAERKNDPMFFAPKGGMMKMVDALRNRLDEGGVEIRTGVSVDDITHGDAAFGIATTSQADDLRAEAVVVATPTHTAASMLEHICPDSVQPLSDIEYASVAIVRLAYERSAFTDPLEGSGFVVPAVEGRLMTACSWASSKWQELSGTDKVILRASVGRFGDERTASMSDTQLVNAVHDELTETMGAGSRPVAHDVIRWERSFPQYEPGHLARVLAIERAVGKVPGLALAGAAYHGLGIPACIQSGSQAAERVLSSLARS